MQYYEQICDLTAEELDGWVLEALDNGHINIEQERWKSNVNQYICYDSRPFCTKNMRCILNISSNNYLNLSFFMYCFNKFKKLREKLEKTLELNCNEIR